VRTTLVQGTTPDPVDSDGDGVPDAEDACVDQPAATEDGCPSTSADSDGDGVPDAEDACVDEPAGTEDGCPSTSLDSDGDGLPDATDNCPTSQNADQQDDDGDGRGNACELPPTIQIVVDQYKLGCPDEGVGEALRGDPENCAAVTAVAGTEASTITAREVLALLRGTRDRPASNGRLRSIGVAVSFEVTLEGFVGERADVTWSLYHGHGGGQVPRSWLINHRVLRLEGQVEKDFGSYNFWVPLPKLHGPFYVRINVVDKDGNGLTFKNSSPFG
jgi:hypothetical protein